MGGYLEVLGNNTLNFRELHNTDSITASSENSYETYYLNSCLVNDKDNNKNYDTVLVTTDGDWVDTSENRTFYVNDNNSIIQCGSMDAGAISSRLEVSSSNSYSDILGSGVYTGYISDDSSNTRYIADDSIMQQIQLGQQINIEYLDIGYVDASNSYNIAIITRIV